MAEAISTKYNFKDLTGNVYGRLTVTGFSHFNKQRMSHWVAKCSCGNPKKIIVCIANLKRNQSCGCIKLETIRKANFVDLTGQIFGRLSVNRFSHFNKDGAYFICICSCNNKETTVKANNLQQGKTKSCGCLALEVRTKHGLCGTQFYNSYRSMISRCYNINDISYSSYGGRGITVCDRWLGKEGFIHYIEDRYATYLEHVKQYGKRNTTNERLDPNGNYIPENCIWATYHEQGLTRRNSPISEDLDQHHYWKRRLATLLWQGATGRLKNSPLFEHYIGLTTYEFRYYLQEQFESWMNWNNNGRKKGKWVVDHIIQCYKFDLSKEQDRLDCFNYKNLRPYDWQKNLAEQLR